MNNSSYGSAGVGFSDGTYMPIGELSIPVTDMGFQLSDMCYDAIHVKDGRFFRLDDHLDRFERSLALGRYDSLGMERGDIADALHGCVARAGLRDSMVTVVAARGTPASGLKDLRTCKNRFMAWALPFYGVISDEEMETGADIIVAETIRIPADAVDPSVKNFARLDFVRALFEAYDRGTKYAVLLDTDGNVAEGRGWNIFIVKEGRLLSPESGVLEGITRKTVIELAEQLNVEARLARIPVADLRAADEAFVTSTAGGIAPVRSIDGKTIDDGSPGPLTQRLTEMYWALHEDPAFTTPVDYAMAEDTAG